MILSGAWYCNVAAVLTFSVVILLMSKMHERLEVNSSSLRGFLLCDLKNRLGVPLALRTFLWYCICLALQQSMYLML